MKINLKAKMRRIVGALQACCHALPVCFCLWRNVVQPHSAYRRGFSLLVLSLLFGSECLAAAGDSISNTATISYDIAGVAASTSASISFTEDRLINFTVSKTSDGVYDRVVNGMSGAIMTFSVLNSGNARQDFLLAAVNTAPNPYASPADNFNALTPMRVFVENGLTPGYQPGQDSAVFIDELAPNATATVYVLADMPASLNTDDVAAIALIAQVAEGGAVATQGAAINNDTNGRVSPASPSGGYSNGTTVVTAGVALSTPDSSSVDTVFNDPAGASPEDVSSALTQDVRGNGQHVDAGAFQVAPPVVIVKSVTVIDTLGGSDPHPGATLRYQLDVSIAGNSSVANLVINDPIPPDTTYSDGSISLNGAPQSDASDAPADFSRAIGIASKPVTSIEVDLSRGGTVSIAPGDSNTIIFDVTIN